MNEVDEGYDVGKELNLLIISAIKIAARLEGKSTSEVEDNLIFAQDIGKKIVRHALSMQTLLAGHQLVYEGVKYKSQIDFGSIGVIARSFFEAYLTFYFLFVDSDVAEVRECRFRCWKLAGLRQRANAKVTTKAHQEKRTQKQSL